MAVREVWTDERLDDLVKHMDREFDGVRSEIRDVRAELRDVRTEMAAMQRTIIVSQRTTIVGFVAVIGSVLVTQL